jgi:conjugative transfer region protein TrbK
MRARLRSWYSIQRRQHAGAGVVLRVGAVAFVMAAIAVAVMQSRRADEKSAIVVPPAAVANLLAAELVRCRAITPEQLAIDDACHRVWAESRRRFVAPTTSRSLPTSVDAVPAAPALLAKDQDRLPSPGAPRQPGEAR